MKPITRIYSIAIILMTMMPAAYAAEPAETQWDHDRFNINLGGFLVSRDTEVRLDSKTLGQGTIINFEDDLGFDKDRNTVRTDMYFRFNQRHRIDASYYDLSRNSTRIIDRTLQYGDTVFPVNTTIKSDFNFRIMKAAYTYSFMHNQDMELGVTAGLFVQDHDITLRQIGAGGVQEKAAATTPLPVIGLRGVWNISDKLLLRSSIEIFSLDYETYEGHLSDILLTIEHNTFEHVGFGIGYNNTRFKLSAEEDEFFGEVKIDYNGVLIYTKIFF